MKKVILSAVFAGIMGTAAASDGAWDYSTPDYRGGYYPVREVREANPAWNVPCKKNCGQQVRVKTHTEITEHYQVYQPVLIYEPRGTMTETRIVRECKKPCVSY
ncbi:MAG: hypothetical protein FWF97_02385 [Alphaproteobacteria bacterium]|nr:hypothetical protein [Alphaproteobacteria bacterium]